jgi:excinuclease ABC subunit C
VRTAHILLDLLGQVYKVRSCRTPLTEAGVEKGKYKVCLDYHIHKCNGPCEGLISKADYNAMIAEIREVIKGNLGGVLRGLKAVMMDYAAQMEFEQAQLVKEKYDLLENYRSRSTVVSATIHNVEVFSYVDDGEAFFVNFMKVVDGAVVQSHSFEMRRRLDETPEELLLLAITELRQQFDHPAEEIIVPMKLDYALDALLTVPQRGDKQKLLDLSRRNAMQYRIDLEKQRTLVDPERHQKRVLNSLKEALQLNEIPEVIECFDNSNFQGDYAVAGMVQFVKGKPNKSAYRHFNIKTVEGPDDYASMKEVVRRRYSRLIEEGKPLPNLIITDGGKGQMEVVRQVVEDELQINIPIAGLAKDDRHRTNELLFGFPPRVVGLKPNSEVFRLLTHIQDEVHRFAITFHRKKFEKGFMHSELADIKGVGKKTAEKLLLELKSVKGIKEASLERLTEIVGSAKALIVYNHFAVETH